MTMKFGTCHVDGEMATITEHEGVLKGLRWNDAASPGSLRAWIQQGELDFALLHARLAEGETFSSSQVDFLPPFEPGKIICIGLNYADHTAESGMEQPSYPTVFARFASSLVAHDQPLVRPRISDQLDYEGEMVAVIGTRGRDISETDALSHVCGYSVFNDASVRDYQTKSPQWTVGKNFDGTGAFGPWLVPASDVPPGGTGLAIETRLNGQVVQSSSTKHLIFSVARLVSLLSEAFTLEPGDIIVTGTPSGVGAARKPPLYLRPGDICEVTVERIGTLSNPVVAQ